MHSHNITVNPQQPVVYHVKEYLPEFVWPGYPLQASFWYLPSKERKILNDQFVNEKDD